MLVALAENLLDALSRSRSGTVGSSPDDFALARNKRTWSFPSARTTGENLVMCPCRTTGKRSEH